MEDSELVSVGANVLKSEAACILAAVDNLGES